jgi:hypothetical protein
MGFSFSGNVARWFGLVVRFVTLNDIKIVGWFTKTERAASPRMGGAALVDESGSVRL